MKNNVMLILICFSIPLFGMNSEYKSESEWERLEKQEQQKIQERSAKVIAAFGMKKNCIEKVFHKPGPYDLLKVSPGQNFIITMPSYAIDHLLLKRWAPTHYASQLRLLEKKQIAEKIYTSHTMTEAFLFCALNPGYLAIKFVNTQFTEYEVAREVRVQVLESAKSKL